MPALAVMHIRWGGGCVTRLCDTQSFVRQMVEAGLWLVVGARDLLVAQDTPANVLNQAVIERVRLERCPPPHPY